MKVTSTIGRLFLLDWSECNLWMNIFSMNDWVDRWEWKVFMGKLLTPRFELAALSSEGIKVQKSKSVSKQEKPQNPLNTESVLRWEKQKNPLNTESF